MTARANFCAAIALMICVSAGGTGAHDGKDWYHPWPPSPPEKNAPLFLPRSAGRPVFAVPGDVEQMAILKLAEAEILLLSIDDFRDLKIQPSPNKLLEKVIENKATDVEDSWDKV